MNHSQAGFIGGMQTLLRHGKEHYREIGKLGGRPVVITKSLPASENGGNEDGLPNGLIKLKRLYRRKKERAELVR